MSTGAGMLFLFRVERLRMAFRHSCSSLSLLHTEFLRSPAGRPGPDTQTGRAHGGIRQGAGSTSPQALPPALFILISVLLTDDNERVIKDTELLLYPYILYIYLGLFMSEFDKHQVLTF